MTTADLDAIETRAKDAYVGSDLRFTFPDGKDTILTLVAEVKRLKAENEALRNWYADQRMRLFDACIDDGSGGPAYLADELPSAEDLAAGRDGPK